MTIPEACQLVLEAGSMGKGGEIFVFDMGKPLKILDMAKNMIRLSGLEPEKDIKIVFTGLRPGEKLFEELLSDKENTLPTYHPKIKIATLEDHDYKYLIPRIIEIYTRLYSLSRAEIVEFFSEIVPEFNSTNNEYAILSEKEKTFEIKDRTEDILIPLPVESNADNFSKAL
jgi:FlaA1/EpsC-like NDP-sugar epimerase